jgi:hypothetical protein
MIQQCVIIRVQWIVSVRVYCVPSTSPPMVLLQSLSSLNLLNSRTSPAVSQIDNAYQHLKVLSPLVLLVEEVQNVPIEIWDWILQYNCFRSIDGFKLASDKSIVLDILDKGLESVFFTCFGNDEEDEIANKEFLAALPRGRLGISLPANIEEIEKVTGKYRSLVGNFLIR